MIADKVKKNTSACLKKISSFSAMNKTDCYVFLYKGNQKKSMLILLTVAEFYPVEPD